MSLKGVWGHRFELTNFNGIPAIRKTFNSLTDPPSGYPPLNVSGRELAHFAVVGQKFMERPRLPNVTVPKLLSFSKESVTLEYFKDSVPLFDVIRQEGTAGINWRALGKWLGLLHAQKVSASDRKILTNPVTSYKINLQYNYAKFDLTSDSKQQLTKEVNSHLGGTLCHGDFHSKNVLICDQGFVIIDFEHAGVRHPVYDLAYMLSDIILSANLSSTTLPCTECQDFLSGYIDAVRPRDFHIPRSLSEHTLVQNRYRLEGPSSSVWTTDVDPELKSKLTGDQGIKLVSSALGCYAR